MRTEDELVISQSLLELARIYRAQHDLVRAEAMLKQVEPRLRRDLPPGHYAFAALPTERGLIAFENHDLPEALRLMNQAIAMLQAVVKAGGEGGFSLPGLYIYRSRINLAQGHADQAEADANLALAALHPEQHPGDISSKFGRAYPAQASALASEGKTAPARAAATLAVTQLQAALGADHPDTQSARKLTQ
jgi:hypothetical protein